MDGKDTNQLRRLADVLANSPSLNLERLKRFVFKIFTSNLNLFPLLKNQEYNKKIFFIKLVDNLFLSYENELLQIFIENKKRNVELFYLSLDERQKLEEEGRERNLRAIQQLLEAKEAELLAQQQAAMAMSVVVLKIKRYELAKQKVEMLKEQKELFRESAFGAAADRLISKGLFDAADKNKIIGLAKKCADDPEIKRLLSRYNDKYELVSGATINATSSPGKKVGYYENIEELGALKAEIKQKTAKIASDNSSFNETQISNFCNDYFESFSADERKEKEILKAEQELVALLQTMQDPEIQKKMRDDFPHLVDNSSINDSGPKKLRP